MRVVQGWSRRIAVGVVAGILALLAHQVTLTGLRVAFQDENDAYWGLEVSGAKKRLVTRESFNDVVEETVDSDGDQRPDILRVYAREGERNAAFSYVTRPKEGTIEVEIGAGSDYQGAVRVSNMTAGAHAQTTFELKPDGGTGQTWCYTNYDGDSKLDVMIKRVDGRVESVFASIGTAFHRAKEMPRYRDGYWRVEILSGDSTVEYILKDYEWRPAT